MSKAQLRREFLAKRKAFANRQTSISICKSATCLPAFVHAKTIMLYLASNYEVDTSFLIAESRRLGKRICAPRVLNQTDMDVALIDDSGFQRGAFGIWEPKGEPVEDVDIIFVPGVAFDKSGNRLGYGKGYYDRFLEGRHAMSVGIAYACQIAEELPTDAHDKRLDMILTEEGLCK